MKSLLAAAALAVAMSASAQTIQIQVDPGMVNVQGPDVHATVEVRQTSDFGPGPSGPGPSAAPVAQGPVGMADSDFDALKQAVENEGFADKKVAVVQTAASGNWFTIDQVGQLVDLMAFSDGKVKTVSILKGRIVDRNNAFKLYDHFSFSSDKEKVEKILK